MKGSLSGFKFGYINGSPCRTMLTCKACGFFRGGDKPLSTSKKNCKLDEKWMVVKSCTTLGLKHIETRKNHGMLKTPPCPSRSTEVGRLFSRHRAQNGRMPTWQDATGTSIDVPLGKSKPSLKMPVVPAVSSST